MKEQIDKKQESKFIEQGYDGSHLETFSIGRARGIFEEEIETANIRRALDNHLFMAEQQRKSDALSKHPEIIQQKQMSEALDRKLYSGSGQVKAIERTVYDPQRINRNIVLKEEDSEKDFKKDYNEENDETFGKLVSRQEDSGAESDEKDTEEVAAIRNTTSISKPLQRKIKVSQPDDSKEKEADEISEKVMRMGDEASQEEADADDEISTKLVSRQEDINEEDLEDSDETIAAKQSSSGEVSIDNSTSDYINNLSGGEPMREQDQQFFGDRFGADFSNVRIHTDGPAAQSARGINAKAYTKGNNIVFGKGQYQPDTSSGKKLMAHELVHVRQQGGVQRKGLSAKFKKKEKNQGQKYFFEFNIDYYGADGRVVPLHGKLNFNKPITIYNIIKVFKAVIKTQIHVNASFENKIYSVVIKELLNKGILQKENSKFKFYKRIKDDKGNISVIRINIPKGHFQPYNLNAISNYNDPEFPDNNVNAIFQERMRIVELYKEMMSLEMWQRLRNENKNFASFWSEASFYVHTALDLLGLIPVVGEGFDAINAAIYAAEGDKVGYALSMAAMIPFAGWFATGAKLGIKGAEKLSKSAAKKIAKDATEEALKKYIKGGSKVVTRDVAEKVTREVGEKLYKNLIEEAGEILSKNVQKIIADNIRKVGPDILDKMEKAGGHLIERHVGKTNQELIKRGMTESIEAASTFYNKKIAIKVVQESLRKNADEIAEWLLKGEDIPRKNIFCNHKFVIGKGLKAGKKNITDNLNKSVLYLFKDKTQELGFRIISGNPIF